MSGFVVIESWSSNCTVSPNGTIWSDRTLPTNAGVGNRIIAWSGTIFCMVGETDNVLVSTDGSSWSSHNLPSTGFINSSIAWNGTIFCIVQSASTKVATSPDGVTWTLRTSSSAQAWYDVAWGAGVFCAIANATNAAMTSPNGITWTNRTLPATRSWRGIAFNGSVFCAIASTEDLATSPDGVTWTSRANPNPLINWDTIIANGTIFCAMSSYDVGQSMTSTDGITWTVGTGVGSGSWKGVAHNGTNYCSVSTNGTDIITSTDGVNWTIQAGVLSSSHLWDVICAGTVSSATIYYDSNIDDISIILNDINKFISNTETISNYSINSTDFTSIITHTFYEIVSEILSLHLDPTDINLTVITDIIQYGFLLNYLEINNIVESILLHESHTSKNIVTNSINEYFTIIDIILIKYLLTINESITYTSDILGIIKQIENIVSTISINSNLNNKIILLNNIIDLLNLFDIISAGISKTISESIIINDTINTLSKFINTLVESLTINLDTIVVYTGLERILSNINTLDLESDKVKYNNILSESFILSIPTASGQDSYLAYLLSPETDSVTNYNNYNFKGCTKFNSKYLFYNNTGLYEYGGSTDNGDLIESHITTTAYNFGSTNLKQVPSIYLGISNSDKIYLKVSVDGKTNCLYTLNKKTENLQTQKIDIGKGLIGRYFQFELITKADTFDLESIDFYPIELRRKI